MVGKFRLDGEEMKKGQLLVLYILILIYAICAFLSYYFFVDQLALAAGAPVPDPGDFPGHGAVQQGQLVSGGCFPDNPGRGARLRDRWYSTERF